MQTHKQMDQGWTNLQILEQHNYKRIEEIYRKKPQLQDRERMFICSIDVKCFSTGCSAAPTHKQWMESYPTQDKTCHN